MPKSPRTNFWLTPGPAQADPDPTARSRASLINATPLDSVFCMGWGGGDRRSAKYVSRTSKWRADIDKPTASLMLSGASSPM
eukprot:4086973-Pyramimonas_sp.AAC.1